MYYLPPDQNGCLNKGQSIREVWSGRGSILDAHLPFWSFDSSSQGRVLSYGFYECVTLQSLSYKVCWTQTDHQKEEFFLKLGLHISCCSWGENSLWDEKPWFIDRGSASLEYIADVHFIISSYNLVSWICDLISLFPCVLQYLIHCITCMYCCIKKWV